MNSKGEIVIDSKKIYPIVSYCGNFYNGVTVIYVESNSPNEVTTGYMNKKGKLVHSKTFKLPEGLLKEEFSVFDDFHSNMAMYTYDWNDGFINNKFKEVIPPVLEFARNFEDDLAYVKYKDREGYINKKGKWIWVTERTGM